MRRSMTFSALLHLAILALVIFGLPRWHEPIEVAPSIPVEVVTIAENSAAPKTEPKPEPVQEEPKPEPPKAPEPPKPVAETPPAPTPPPLPEPEPLPEPAPQEVAAVAPEPEPEPIPLPEPEPEPKPKPEPEVKKPEPPKPVAKPKPPAKPKQEAKKPEEKKPAEPQKPSFLKTVEKLKQETKTAEAEPPKEPEPQPQPQPVAAPGSIEDQLTRSNLEAAIREQVERCWNVPAGARDADDLVVEIRVVLGRDGSVVQASILDLTRASTDDFYRAAAESARRAVLNCSPLRELPADRYDIWQTLTLRFNPKEMLGT